MKCELCGADTAVLKETTKNFGQGDNLVVIENIPIVRCSTCRDSYLTADTARELDRIRKNRQSLGETKSVLVAKFGRCEIYTESLIHSYNLALFARLQPNHAQTFMTPCIVRDGEGRRI